MAVVNLDDPSDVAAWNRRAPAPAPTDADIIALADKTRTGEPGRDGYILPISFARAVLAKWGTPAPASQPVAAPAGMEPVYQIGQPFPFDPENTWRDASKDAYDVWMPNRRRIIYTASQVQAMLAAVPRNAPLYDPDDVAFPVQRSADGVDALPPELASIAKRASTAAAEVTVPSEPAREPLRCSCHTCWPISVADPASMFIRLCPCCGNKRCPKANDHRHDCTGSNEPGQPGSAYPPQGITAAQKVTST